ncbi:efflux transporter outer membrane subunit [Parafilimonas sp.]|uniref:efflux transporter outer membrane subunit n=1 Tax=Parafilimonas sp. TaxID=1969739 RepID=UPI0039E27C16
MKMNKIVLFTGLSVTVAACRVTHSYQSPFAPVTENYRGSDSTDTTSIADIPWKQMFADTILQRLIQQALYNNLDVKVAVARIKYAEANVRQSKAAFLPDVSADADYTLSKSSIAQLKAYNQDVSATPLVRQYALTASVSWEADVWGKLKSTKKAYIAALLSSDAYKRAVQTEIVASVASNYYALMAYDKQLSIAKQTIEIRKSDTATVKQLKEYAVLNGADVVQSEANMYAAQIEATTVEKSIRETENAISVLLGRMPGSIPRSTLDEQVTNNDLHTGVPLQLLRNRPDVQEAEYNFRNAFELTNVARTYFYPSLTITGSGGWATANTLKGFFDGTFYGSLIGGLTQPIFNQGLNKQRLKQAEATQEEYLYTFQQTMLTASQEVADALYSYQNAAALNESRVKQIASLNKAVDYTKELLRYTSTVNYTDVLTAETSLLSAQLSNISDKLQQLQATVELYRALGGGWK